MIIKQEGLKFMSDHMLPVQMVILIAQQFASGIGGDFWRFSMQAGQCANS